MRNTYGRLEVRDENLSINYVTICKLLTIAWRTKKAFVSRIPKVSSSHKFAAHFGLYSLPTKAKIYLGPYSVKEFPRVSLLPFGGGPPFSVCSFHVPWSATKKVESPKLRKILPKKVGLKDIGEKSPAEPCIEIPSPDKSDTALASTSKDNSPEAQVKSLSMKTTLKKLDKAKIDQISKGSKPASVKVSSLIMVEESVPQSDSTEEEVDVGVDQLASADHGFFTCSNEKIAIVPFVMFGKTQCQMKHPMGSKLMRFKSILLGLKFLNYIYRDMYAGVIAWKYNFGMSSKSSLQDYAYIKSAKVSQGCNFF